MPTIVRFHQLGGPENLKFEDAAPQEPAKGEVRLRVKAAGLNRAEALYCRGQYLELPKLPSRIGYEVAGVVEAVGESVDLSWIGKSVATIPAYGMNQYGTLGEQAVVPAYALTEYPKNLTPEQAASAWMQYLTAYGALVFYGKVGAGDFVSIPAASSSVGLAAIQIVRDAGATAIAVTRTSAKKHALIALGAHHVIVSGEEDYAAQVKQISGGKGARLIFDPVAGPYVETLCCGRGTGQASCLSMVGFRCSRRRFHRCSSFRTGLSVSGAYSVREITRRRPERLAAAKLSMFSTGLCG